MLKSYLSALALSAVCSISSVQAGESSNRVILNGLQLNGLSSNIITVNGLRFNQLHWNGLHFNQLHWNGSHSPSETIVSSLQALAAHKLGR